MNYSLLCHFAGNLFEPAPSGLTAHLAPLLEQYGCKAVQTRTYAMTYQAGTPSGQAYSEDMQRAFQTLRPFILKWGRRTRPEDYDALRQQALAEIQAELGRVLPMLMKLTKPR